VKRGRQYGKKPRRGHSYMERNRTGRPKRSILAAAFDWCVYCGDPANCFDHFLTWSKTRDSSCLPACAECNARLHDASHTTLGERTRCLIDRFLKKHQKTLSNDVLFALEETTGHLRVMLLQQMLMQAMLRRRLCWMEHFAALTERLHLVDLKIDSEHARNLTEMLENLHRQRLDP
jgi:hypothetical protein